MGCLGFLYFLGNKGFEARGIVRVGVLVFGRGNVVGSCFRFSWKRDREFLRIGLVGRFEGIFWLV